MARTPRKPKKKNTKACIDLGDLHPHVTDISKQFDLTLTATIKLLLRRSLGLEHVVGSPNTFGPIRLPAIPHGLGTWTNQHDDLTPNQAHGSNPASDV